MDPLFYFKTQYAEQKPYLTELQEFLKKYEKDIPWILEQESNPWWHAMIHTLQKKRKDDDAQYMISQYKDNHPHELEFTVFFSHMLDTMPYAHTYGDYSKSTWNSFMQLLDYHEVTHLRKVNVFVDDYKSRTFKFKSHDWNWSLFPLKYELLFPRMNGSEWMKFLKFMTSYISMEKSGNYRWSQVDAAYTHMKHYAKYYPVYHKELTLAAWLDDEGPYRILHYAILNKNVPYSRKDATQFLRTRLYEHYGVSFAERSRIETLLPPTTEDNRILIRQSLENALNQGIRINDEIDIVL